MATFTLSQLFQATNGNLVLDEPVQIGTAAAKERVASFTTTPGVTSCELLIVHHTPEALWRADNPDYPSVGFLRNDRLEQTISVAPSDVIEICVDPAVLHLKESAVGTTACEFSIDVWQRYADASIDVQSTQFHLSFSIQPPVAELTGGNVALRWSNDQNDVPGPSGFERTRFGLAGVLRVEDKLGKAVLSPVEATIQLNAVDRTLAGLSSGKPIPVQGIVFRETNTPTMSLSLPLPADEKVKQFEVGVSFGEADDQFPPPSQPLLLEVSASLSANAKVASPALQFSVRPATAEDRIEFELRDTYDNSLEVGRQRINPGGASSSKILQLSSIRPSTDAVVCTIDLGFIKPDATSGTRLIVEAAVQHASERLGLRWEGNTIHPDVSTPERFEIQANEQHSASLIADLRNFPEGESADLRVTMQLESSLLVERVFQLTVQRPPGRSQGYLALDIGTSATAAAFKLNDGSEDGAPRALNLARLIEGIDRDRAEQGTGGMISSNVGCNPDPKWNWRRGYYDVSLWHRDGDDNQASRLPWISVPFVPHRRASDPDARVISALKLQILNLNQSATIASSRHAATLGQSVNTEAALEAQFSELGELHLPWDENFPKLRNAKLLLTHPNQFLERHLQVYKRACGGLARSLGTDTSNVILVPESIASSAGTLIRRRFVPNQELHSLVFDLGSGTLDVSLMSFRTSENGNVIGSLNDLNSVGASVGGDTIDFVLYFIVHEKLCALNRKYAGFYQYDMLQDAADNANHLAAKFNMAGAIRAAKADLCKRLRDEGAPYSWQSKHALKLQIGGAPGGDSDRWPASADHGDWRSKMEADENLSFDGPGGSNNLHLELSREEVDVPAMRALMDFMVCDVINLVVNGIPDLPQIDNFVVTGRASLWPLLWERFERAEGPLGEAELLTEGTIDPDAMKLAVAKGAIEAVVSGWAPGRRINQNLRWGMLSLSGNQEIRGLEPLDKAKENRVHSIGELAVVRYPSGMDPNSLADQPWSIALLTHSGFQTNRGAMKEQGFATDADFPLRIIERPGQPARIIVAESYEAGEASPLPRRRSILLPNANVLLSDAPPGWSAG